MLTYTVQPNPKIALAFQLSRMQLLFVVHLKSPPFWQRSSGLGQSGKQERVGVYVRLVWSGFFSSPPCKAQFKRRTFLSRQIQCKWAKTIAWATNLRWIRRDRNATFELGLTFRKPNYRDFAFFCVWYLLWKLSQSATLTTQIRVFLPSQSRKKPTNLRAPREFLKTNVSAMFDNHTTVLFWP